MGGGRGWSERKKEREGGRDGGRGHNGKKSIQIEPEGRSTVF